MNKQEYLSLIDRVIEEGKYKDDWASLADHPVPKWYSDAKFGIFIHWGVFSVPAYSYEWYPRHMYIEGTREYNHHVETYGTQDKFGYKDFIPMFRGEKFDADAWVDLFARAGAKYMTPVAEHHDGFQMYDSDLSRWNASKMGPCRDVLGELKAAAERRGIKFCTSSHRAEHWWYFNGGRKIENSDVNDPQYEDFYGPAVWVEEYSKPYSPATNSIYAPAPDEAFLDDWLARTCELIDKYRPGFVYFDWWIHNAAFKPYLKKFAAYYYNRAEEWGAEVTINYKFNAFSYTTGVYDIERGQFSAISPRLWQNDTAIAKNSWGYTENNDYKDANSIICDLIDVVSKNGCLMLNVGPKPDGTITDEETAVLLEIGDWLRVNGEGIYGSTFWKKFGEGPTEIPEGSFQDTERGSFTPEDIRYTFRDGNVYAYVLACPENGKITMKELRQNVNFDLDCIIKDVTLLGFEAGSFEWNRTTEGLEITLNEGVRSPHPICFRINID